MASPMSDHHDGSAETESVGSTPAPGPVAFGGEDDRAPGSAADATLGDEVPLSNVPVSALMPGSTYGSRGLSAVPYFVPEFTVTPTCRWRGPVMADVNTE